MHPTFEICICRCRLIRTRQKLFQIQFWDETTYGKLPKRKMWELDYKESWALKNWCFWTVVLEKTLECPLDCKEIQPVHPKGDQSWVSIGRTDAEAETPILWPPDGKSWLIWKDPDAGKDWRQEEKGTTEDDMAGWHHRLNGHEFGWTSGVADGQGGLACCGSWGCKESDTTEQLNWREKSFRNLIKNKTSVIMPLAIFFIFFGYFRVLRTWNREASSRHF